jgi:ribosomal protein L11 methyltransferase
MKDKRYRILILQVTPKNLDLALGFLYKLGLTTLEQKRNRSGTWLLVKVGFDQITREFTDPFLKFKTEDGQRIFKSIKYKTILHGRWAQALQKDLRPFMLVSPREESSDLPTLWIEPRRKISKLLRKDTLYIQPGMAFGTGEHPTTQMSAELLCKVLVQEKKAKVLDLGCGTGILAMVAKKMGVKTVWGIDNDPTALEVAQENFSRNKIKEIVLKETLDETRQKFQVIVSNILFKTLVELKDKILRHLAPQGFLIISGIVYQDCEALIEEYKNLTLIERKNKDAWSALLFKNEN